MNPCDKCQLPVRWAKEQGKWQCFNANGSIHWDTCSQERSRLAKKHGKPFKDQDGAGVRWQGKKRYNHQHNPNLHVTGRGAPIPPWPEGVLPWEDA